MLIVKPEAGKGGSTDERTPLCGTPKDMEESKVM